MGCSLNCQNELGHSRDNKWTSGHERDATGICVESVESGQENVRAAEIRVCFTPWISTEIQEVRPKPSGAKDGVMQEREKRQKHQKYMALFSFARSCAVATGERERPVL